MENVKNGLLINQSLLDQFGKVWVNLFAWPGIPLYLHVLTCHYNDLQRRFGNLNTFSQQSMENYHSKQKAMERRSTSHGGGKGNKNMYEQLLTSDLRDKQLRHQLK